MRDFLLSSLVISIKLSLIRLLSNIINYLWLVVATTQSRTSCKELQVRTEDKEKKHTERIR